MPAKALDREEMERVKERIARIQARLPLIFQPASVAALVAVAVAAAMAAYCPVCVGYPDLHHWVCALLGPGSAIPAWDSM